MVKESTFTIYSESKSEKEQVMNPIGKYKAFSPGFKLENRRWPDQTITHAPIWCSVDLRDGNQALAKPMNVETKLEFFQTLVKCGFKEIEVGFPASSDTEYQFTRRLIEENLIPDDVTIQVLTQAREELIATTCQALRGAKRVIIHLYNSTSRAQREIVFGKTKDEIKTMAVQGTEWVAKYAKTLAGTEVGFEYSPESFSATETDFALEVCNAVMNTWVKRIGSDRKVIFNLPETVEVATPNIYADQVEYFCKKFAWRDRAIISLHTHNDRGTGIAATELGLMAGADRVEGTLFGNGERTGNCDIITVALNMYSQGINPRLEFSNLLQLVEVYERCTGMKVPERQPYSGELVWTAFSGSHQDAIRKGLKKMAEAIKSGLKVLWNVPYLIMDPADVGRTYEEVIRVNGQSGKGGIAYRLEQNYGIHMPKDMEREFGVIAGRQIDALGREVTAKELHEMFWAEYFIRDNMYILKTFRDMDESEGVCRCFADVLVNGSLVELNGKGNGPIAAFIDCFRKVGVHLHVLKQSEHAMEEGEDANAISYIELKFDDGHTRWGAGMDTNSKRASIKAIISALNRK